ncbi:hypothetical protein F442_18484 [Phytophthora nicotianae P10297]|uniref:5'-nucleotidase n=1 Tax=Phytophthora nicotianae P10297 TaxID=1317064 RepID=W2YFC1_PHYNI|nr:hypothetical protein F442_18484 [Phytophthora nicotianae P10297]
MPILVFSADLYDVIHIALENEFVAEQKRRDAVHDGGHRYTPDSVHIVANMMQFNDHSVIEGFRGETIHPLTKTAHSLLESSFWKEHQFEKRRNVLLLRDSKCDSRMAEGLDVDETIRVGFLNIHVEETLDDYFQLFDVVFTNDSSLIPVEHLLKQIINGSCRQ